jgi:hypothetical protein
MSPTGRRTGRSRSPWAAIRQWRFPRALRIGPAEPIPGLDELAAAVQALAEQARPATTATTTSDGSGPAEPPLDDGALAGLATGLWRVRRRMLAPGSEDEPRPELHREFLPVRSAWDALAGAGVDVQGHDGVRYTSGLALEVLAFQPAPGLEHEEVVETIRPSVYLRGRMIQLGQVIVGTPTGDEAGDEEGRTA